MVAITAYHVPMDARFTSNRMHPPGWFREVWAFGGMDDRAMCVSGYEDREVRFHTLLNVLAAFQLSPEDFETWTSEQRNIAYDLCPCCLVKLDSALPPDGQHDEECETPEYAGGYVEPEPEPEEDEDGDGDESEDEDEDESENEDEDGETDV